MGRYNEVTNLPYTRSKHTPVSHCYIFYSVRFLQWCPGTQDHRWTCVKNTRGTCTDSEETWFNDFFRKIGHSRLQDFAMYEIKRERERILRTLCKIYVICEENDAARLSKQVHRIQKYSSSLKNIRVAREFIITRKKKHHRLKVAIIWNRGTFSSWIMFATLHELIQFPTELKNVH